MASAPYFLVLTSDVFAPTFGVWAFLVWAFGDKRNVADILVYYVGRKAGWFAHVVLPPFVVLYTNRAKHTKRKTRTAYSHAGVGYLVLEPNASPFGCLKQTDTP